MTKDYFTKASEISEKIKNLRRNFTKRQDELKKDLENQKVSKEEYDEMWRQMMLENADNTIKLLEEQQKLNKEHIIEEEDD